MIPPPSQDVREYIKALGSIAVYACTRLSDGRELLGVSPDPWQQAIDDGGCSIWWIRWVYGTAEATIAMAQIYHAGTTKDAMLRHPTERARLTWAIEFCEPNILGASHEHALRIAEHAVAKVSTAFKTLKAKGELREVGRQYREDRKKAEQEGKDFEQWEAVEERYRLFMIRMAAGQVADRFKRRAG